MTTNELDFLHYKKTLSLFPPMGTEGPYNIPKVKGIRFKNLQNVDMIGFNYATQKDLDSSYYIHFYLGDYKIEKLWKLPDRYLRLLSRFRGIVMPDFSMYTNMAKALQIYNLYRNSWLAAYAQRNGIRVIPSVTWSDNESLNWCFDGMPKRSCVCVSTVGCIKNPEVRKQFMAGYKAMLERLQPIQIIFYGRVNTEIVKQYDGEYVVIKDDMKKRIELYSG